jgi:chemotaxis protein MotB
MRKKLFLEEEEHSQDYYWPSFTDMMTMLVLVILFIAILAFIQTIYDTYEQAEVRNELIKTANVKKQISDLIENKLEEQVGKDKVVRGPNNTISIENDILFESGSAIINENGKSVLKSLSNAIVEIIEDQELSRYLYIILIEGHTDQVPYDNWTLSTDRAVAVVKYMMYSNPKLSKKEYAQYMAATGYSEYKPISNGTSFEALRQNRRISFQIILDDEQWQKKLKTLIME